MKGLLIRAAERSKDRTLIKRMENAYVFKVTFETDSTTGTVLNHEKAEFQISYRMLYQLSTEGKSWSSFADKLERIYPERLCIESVIDILADLRKVDKVENITVILCVDDLHKLENDGTKTCGFYRVMRSLCQFLNSSKAFGVCVCSATTKTTVSGALPYSPQKRLYLVPPALRGANVLSTGTRIQKQLVEDMGGHGRALEILENVLQSPVEPLETINPIYIVEQVIELLTAKYENMFAFPLFNVVNCQEVLATIISQRRYEVGDLIGDTNLTVDDLQSLGLFQRTREGCLEYAFIFLVMLMRRIPKIDGELHVDNFDDHITGSVLVWQRFEHFVGFTVE